MNQELPQDLAARAEQDLVVANLFSSEPASEEADALFVASARTNNDTNEVARRLGIVFAARPDDTKIAVDYLRALRDCRRIAEAMKVAKAGMERYPDNSLFYAEAAYTAFALFDLDSAVALAKRAWSLQPEEPYNYGVMSRILRDTGHFAELREFQQSLLDDRRFGALAKTGLERIREDSAIFFTTGLDRIAAAIKRRDWLGAEQLVRALRRATLEDDIDTILGDRALFHSLMFLVLRLRLQDEVPDGETVAEACRFEAAHRETIASFKQWAQEGNTAASFYFLLGKSRGQSPEDARKYFSLALACDDSFFPARVWLVALERGFSPPTLFAALGTSLPHEKWKYRLAAALLDLRPSEPVHFPSEDAECAICIRGICEAATPIAARYYRHHYPNSRIIVSIWDSTDPALVAAIEPYADRVLLQPDPKIAGYRNINRQIANAYGALCEAEKMGAKTALLARTDFVLFRPRLIEQLTRLVRQGTPEGRGYGPIVVPDAFTRKWIPRHPSDMIMFGRTEDVLGFWSAAWQTGAALNPPPHDAPPEIYLTRAYLDRRDRPAAQRGTADWLSALAELFIVKDFDWFETLWLKQPHLRNTREQSLWSACMSEADWEMIGLSQDQSHTRFFSQRDYTAVYDQILDLPKF